jgi:hypothetical protein
MPINEWLKHAEPNVQAALRGRTEAEQRRWRANPVIESIIERTIWGIIYGPGGSPDNPNVNNTASSAKKINEPIAEDPPSRSSSPASDITGGGLFGDDDGW